MQRIHRFSLGVLALSLFCMYQAVAGEPQPLPEQAKCCDGCAACAEGRCCCENCPGMVCCQVPDTKTTRKVVYSCKLVPFCRTKCPNPLKCRHDACDTCRNCEEKVHYKRVLLKREIVTKKPGFKCVPMCPCQMRGGGEGAPPAAEPPVPYVEPAPEAPPRPTNAARQRLFE